MEERKEGQCSDSEENCKDGGSKHKKRASSAEESEKMTTSSVRPYVRSKMPRLRWTPDLHLRFVNAVERLGGQDRATPKLVLQMMNIKGLNIAHVKSHLQMYRSKKINNQGQVIADHRQHFKGGDPDIYNLSQLPMLQGYNHWHSSTFSIFTRDKDILSWSSGNQWMHNSFARPGTCSSTRTASEKVCSSKNIVSNNHKFNNSESEFTWTVHHELKDATRSLYSHGSLHGCQKMSSPQDYNPLAELIQVREHSETSKSINLQEGMKAMKRKAVDYDLDLDLSLKLNNETNGRAEDKDIGSSLSLSLCFPSSSNIINLDDSKQEQHARRASTLDLTI